MALFAEILQEPWWLIAWVAWIGFVNVAAVAFWSEREARWVLASFVGALVTMQVLYQINGYNRFLGLAHVIFWVPLLIHLYGKLSKVVGPWVFEAWLRMLMATNGVSVVIDVVDVLRYMAGDRT